jgi:hypothetical protein
MKHLHTAIGLALAGGLDAHFYAEGWCRLSFSLRNPRLTFLIRNADSVYIMSIFPMNDTALETHLILVNRLILSASGTNKPAVPQVELLRQR